LVFATPTYPFCPRAAVLAHRMGVASEMVAAGVIDATEFPQRAARYHVRGVPRTVVNDIVYIEGAVPESAFLGQLLPLFEQMNATPALVQFLQHGDIGVVDAPVPGLVDLVGEHRVAAALEATLDELGDLDT